LLEYPAGLGSPPKTTLAIGNQLARVPRLSRRYTVLGQEANRSSRLAGRLEQCCLRFGSLVQ